MELITEPLPEGFFNFDPTSEATRTQDRHSAIKWEEHLKKLCDWGLLVKIAYDEGKHFAYYFAVPKGENMARAIWNGRTLSRTCRAPPAVNLPFLPDLINRLVQLSACGDLHILTGDWRHFFHTIRVSVQLSMYFGVAMESGGGKVRAFRWSTLPMGWSFSPWIAQTVGWAAILHHEPDEEQLFDVPDDLTQLPTFIGIKGGGFVCLYYDNILAANVDHAIMEKVLHRLQRNFGGQESGFNMETNYLTLHTARRQRDPETPATYLGADFGLSAKWSRTGKKISALRWAQTLKKHTKWLTMNPVWTEKFTARNLASYIGKILWRHSISLRPLCAMAPVIKILRRIAKHRTASKCSWDDATFVLSEEEITVMTLHWDLVRANAPHSGAVETVKSHRVRVVSDSSDDAWGYLIFNELGRMDSEHGHQWSETIGARHIFIKELFAAVFAIRHCLATFPKSLEIHIGIDNTAAAAALRNMYSGNVMACEVLDKLSAELSAHNASIHVHGLRSEDNASDPASRGKTASKELVKECFRIMLAAEKGHRINVPSEYNPTTAAGGIRHHEFYEEDDCSLEDLLDAENPLTGEATN